MLDDFSRHRPLLSRQDLTAAERQVARQGAVIVFGAVAACLVAIAALLLANPTSDATVAVLGR